MNRRWTTCVISAAMLAMAATASLADVKGYSRRWDGEPDGNPCGFVPQIFLPGNFMKQTGDELLIIDSDGYVRIMMWTNEGLVTGWTSEEPVVEKGVRSAASLSPGNRRTDIVVFLGEDGKVYALGSESSGFRLLCSDCVPKGKDAPKPLAVGACDSDLDGAQELSLLGDTKGALSILSYEASEKGLSLKSATEAMTKKSDAVRGFFPMCGKESQEYYLLRDSKNGYEMAKLTADEEGVAETSVTRLSDYGAEAGDIERATRKSNSPEFFTMTAYGDDPVLSFFKPGDKESLEKYTLVGSGMNLYTVADLNGSGAAEIILADYNCGFEVHGSSKNSAKVNGQSIDYKKDVRRLSGGRVFVAADKLKNINVKSSSGFTTISRGKRRVIIDHSNGTASLAAPGNEENEPARLAYIREPRRLFVDPVALSDLLQFQCEWDYLADRLDINTGGKR